MEGQPHHASHKQHEQHDAHRNKTPGVCRNVFACDENQLATENAGAMRW